MCSKTKFLLLLTYLVSFIVGTAVFVGLFHTPLFRSVDVLFYRGIALLLVTCAVMTITLVLVTKSMRDRFTKKDIFVSILTLFCVNMLFFTHVPVTADRSISIFLLGYMNEHADKVLTKEDLTNAFLNGYIAGDNTIEKRIHEQLVSGDIATEGKGYRLTHRGRSLIKIYGVVANLFGIDKRLIAPR